MKRVLITGAAGNLGRAVTQRFLKDGYNVAAFIGPEDEPHFLNTENLNKFQADLSDEIEAEETIKEAIIETGPFDFTVFTVGGFAMGPLVKTNLSDLRKIFSLNFETTFNCARIMFGHFKSENGGRMIFIGARPGLDTTLASNMVGYGLSKSLIFHLADIVNVSGKQDHISAVVVVPGVIDTPQNRESNPDADFSKWVSPEIIAENIFYLSSDEAAVLKDPVIKIFRN